MVARVVLRIDGVRVLFAAPPSPEMVTAMDGAVAELRRSLLAIDRAKRGLPQAPFSKQEWLERAAEPPAAPDEHLVGLAETSASLTRRLWVAMMLVGLVSAAAVLVVFVLPVQMGLLLALLTGGVAILAMALVDELEQLDTAVDDVLVQLRSSR